MFKVVSGVCAAVILFAMIKSRHFIKAVLLSGLQGMAALFAVNFIGEFISVHIPMNIFSLLSGIIGGLPGVIYLLVCEIITVL